MLINPKHLEEFTAACIEAVHFTETGDEGQPPAGADIHPDCLALLAADCRQFWHEAGILVLDEKGAAGIETAGHDFWFTRNGHGAGFWDGDWPKHGGELTEAAHRFGEFDEICWEDWEPENE